MCAHECMCVLQGKEKKVCVPLCMCLAEKRNRQSTRDWGGSVCAGGEEKKRCVACVGWGEEKQSKH